MLGVEKMDAIYEGYLDKDEVQIGDITIPLNEGLIDSINMNEHFYFVSNVLLAPTHKKMKKNIDWDNLSLDEVFNKLYVN